MRPRSIRALLAVVVASLGLLPAAAAAQAECSAEVSPNPGWVGAVITFSGSGLEPNVHYDIRIGGGPIIDLLAEADGTFEYQYTIPAVWDSGQNSVGMTEWFVYTYSGCKPMDLTAEPYEVLASQPTTTAAAVTTTAATTTTVAASTTTAAATTTTAAAAATTTVIAADTTTGTAATTTTVASTSDGGGVSPILVVLLAAIAGALVFVGISIQRSRRG